ncbi:putative transmembrane protein [Sesbania bispinosa]|nr:putative transmembrane protein [Sesbania bispinosa]
MSGVSLAVAADKTVPKPKQEPVGSMTMMGSLRVIELQLVAFVLVFSASGLVPLLDLLFPALISIYLLVLARFAFPSYSRGGSQQIFHGSRLFQAYVVVGTTVGLFLPLAYVLGGFGRGDEHAVRCASPHLFLVSFQILTENIISSLSMFSPPVRALVPLMYTVRRIFVDIDWMHNVWLNKTLPANPHLKEKAWFWFGRVLAVANLVYYSINLFGFLIPRFLPRAFKRYFQERGEIYAKEAEDKRYVVINKSYPPVKKSD